MVADCRTSHSIYGRTLRVYGRILLTFLLSLLVSGCDLLFGTTINYRVEATILVHGKPYTGSSVWSMTLKRIVGLGRAGFETTVRGEAIRIDYPGPETIYVLRRLRGLSDQSYGDFPRYCLTADQSAGLPDALRTFQGPCAYTVAPPVVVWTTDPSDPSTFIGLTPPFQDEDCREVCLSSIVVTRTADAITTGLSTTLPWLLLGGNTSKIGTGEAVNPRKTGTGPPRELFNQDFSTEIDRSK